MDKTLWQKLPCGILLKNAPTLDTLCETYKVDVEELGYNKYEIYNLDNLQSDPMIIGYFKLFTNELIAIHRTDNIVMTSKDIDLFLEELFKFTLTDEENYINEGISNKGISQKYIETTFNTLAKNNSLSNGKYVFEFSDGFLCNFRQASRLSAYAREFLDVEGYMQEANTWYHGDMDNIFSEINLHASCLVNIPYEILTSSIVKNKFSYPNGLCNFIAMAFHYNIEDIDFKDLLNSLHGNYDVLENNSYSIKIKAYGEVFSNYTSYSDLIEDRTSNLGYIYVMVNPSLPNLVKIGKTKRNPSDRAKELSSATGVPTPFIVVYEKEFHNCDRAEKEVHDILTARGYRTNESREFFTVPIPEAIDTILSIDVE